MPSRLSFAFTIAAALLSTPLAAAADEGLLLAPTPLVLKDGRIAQVTIHTIRFPLGKDEPEATERQALAGLVEELATDCFLTAQAVGHVEPGPGSDGETLAAHRLARARADRVQAALTGRGLPAGSIASVWDWQFAVREPRVTLWVFRLAEGDDCDSQPIAADGTPATGDRTPVTADAAQPAQPPAEAAPERMAVVEAEALPQALQASEDVDEPLPVAAAVDAAAPEAGEPQLAGTVPHEAGEPQLAGTVSHETGEPQLTGAGPSGAAGSPEVMPPEV
ncbi:MAG TPA: hypothetical protein PKA09_07520, partial [Geminicoccus sp.]|nr:hypothetical protein [Geminicoccus sp.]